VVGRTVLMFRTSDKNRMFIAAGFFVCAHELLPCENADDLDAVPSAVGGARLH
jgi:hypothetical protein